LKGQEGAAESEGGNLRGAALSDYSYLFLAKRGWKEVKAFSVLGEKGKRPLFKKFSPTFSSKTQQKWFSL